MRRNLLNRFSGEFALAGTLLLAGASAHAEMVGPGSITCPALYEKVELRSLRGSAGERLLPRYASPDAKQKFILTAFKDGDPDYGAADAFASRVRELDPAEQREWLAAIGAVYRQVPKEVFRIGGPAVIGGKRLLDRAVALLQDTSAYFAQRVHGGDAGPALRAYLDDQARLFGGGYDADEVMAVLELLQKQLKDYARKANGGPPPSFLLGGSFPNGRAKLLSSDVDLTLQPLDLRHEMPELADKINNVFKGRGKESGLKIEPHGEPAHFYGAINPLVFRVTPDGVTLMVFPPGAQTHVKDRLMGHSPVEYRMSLPDPN